jgi:hypothetical protein
MPSWSPHGTCRCALLADLRGRLDDSWRRYVVNALTDSLGLNPRDLVSHGLYGPVSRADAAIARHIADSVDIVVRDGGRADQAPEGPEASTVGSQTRSKAGYGWHPRPGFALPPRVDLGPCCRSVACFPADRNAALGFGDELRRAHIRHPDLHRP